MFAMFVHEPAERTFLLSMKLARFSLMRVQVLALGIGTRQQDLDSDERYFFYCFYRVPG